MTSSPKYTLQLINQKGAIEQTVHIDPSAAPAQKRPPLSGQTGMRFNLFDDEALIGPQRFIARRDGYDLQIFLDANTVNMFNAATAQPDIVVADYYGTCAASELSVDESVGVIDTLALDGGNILLDLSAIATHGDRITSVERIDLTGTGDNTLRLTVADVLDIASQNSFNASAWSGLAATQTQHQLVVDGNAGDKLFTGSGWTLSATSVTNDSHVYRVYDSGAAQLLVDERVQVVA